MQMYTFILLRTYIALALSPIIYLLSLAWLDSYPGAAIITAMWILLIVSNASIQALAFSTRQGRIDAKMLWQLTLWMQYAKASILLILFALSLTQRLLWLTVVTGIWLLLVAAATIRARRIHPVSETTPREEILMNGAVRVAKVVSLLWALMVWIIIAMWWLHIISSVIAQVAAIGLTLLAGFTAAWLICRRSIG